jgi:signal transduction histidine kinase
LQPEFSTDASGELLGWVGVWSDVTALRRLQRLSVEAERAHAREAERNRELQEQFIDITCHELRNPLNAIYNSAALLGESLSRIEAALNTLREQDGGAFAQQPEFEKINAELQEDIDSANTIVLCARHQKRITDGRRLACSCRHDRNAEELLLDVLNVSKLSAGLITLVTAAFSPYEEVKNTVRMFRDEVSARGLTMEFERDPSLDALQVDRVRGDSGRFVQVVVNLLSNAIKFTETAPRHHVRIRIGATEHREDISTWPEMAQDDLTPMCRAAPADPHTSYIRIYVAVEDSGHGMTEDEQQRVFQRFAQASPRTYGEFGGHGLGLASVHHYSKASLDLTTGPLVRLPDAGRTAWWQDPSSKRPRRRYRDALLHCG